MNTTRTQAMIDAYRARLAAADLESRRAQHRREAQERLNKVLGLRAA